MWSQPIFYERADGGGLALRGAREYWRRLHVELAQIATFLAAHAQHWGLVAPDDGDSGGGGGGGGGYGGGGGGYGGGGGGRDVVAAGGQGELRREAESMSGLYALLQRAAEAAAFLATLAPTAAGALPTAAGAGEGVMPALTLALTLALALALTLSRRLPHAIASNAPTSPTRWTGCAPT